MGGFGAFLGGMGNSMQDQNMQSARLDHETNQHMADAIGVLADNAKPQYQDQWRQLQAQWMYLKPGQKPSKDMLDLHGLMKKQLQDTNTANTLATAHEAEVQRRIGEANGQAPGSQLSGEGLAGGGQLPGATGSPAPTGMPPPPGAGAPAPSPAPASAAPPPAATSMPPPPTQAEVAPSGPDPNVRPDLARVPNSMGDTNVTDQAPQAIPTVSTPPPGMNQLTVPQTVQASQVVSPGVQKPDGSAMPNAPSAGFSNGAMTPPPSTGEYTFYTPEEQDARKIGMSNAEAQGRNTAELGRLQGTEKFKHQQNLQYVQELKQQGVWDTLSVRQQAEIISGRTLGVEHAPTKYTGTISADQIPEGTLDTEGNKIVHGSGQSYGKMQDPQSGEFIYYPQQVRGRTSTEVAPDQQSASRVTVNPYTGQPIASRATALPAGYQNRTTTRDQYINTGDGLQHVTMHSTRSLGGLGGGGAGGGAGGSAATQGMTPPPGSPTTSSGGSSTGRAAQGSPGPQASGGDTPNFVPKRLNPNQKLNASQDAPVLDTAIGATQRIRDNIGLMNDIITAKKVLFETEPTTGLIRGIINNKVPMTDQERQMAADMITLTQAQERVPSAQHFKNVVAQDSGGMRNPQVTAKVMDNMLRQMNQQRAAYTAAGIGGQQVMTPPPGAGGAGGESGKGGAGGDGAGAKEVTDRKEYDALPAGSPYMQNGVLYHKGSAVAK